MNQQKLMELMDDWENLNLIIQEAGNHPEHFSVLMDIALHSTENKSWRAAWMADKIHDKYPHLVLPYLEPMIEKLRHDLQQGKKRQFLKLISLHNIPEKYFGFLVDKCIEFLTSAKEPPAIRVHAMQVLYNISEKEPDLKPEILAVIRHEMEYHSTAGIISRGSKLAKKLQRQIGQTT